MYCTVVFSVVIAGPEYCINITSLTSQSETSFLTRIHLPDSYYCDVSDVSSQGVGLQVETHVSVCLHSPASFVSSQVCVQYNPFIKFSVVHKIREII